MRLIFTHNSGNPPLHKWLREAKKCLIKNEKAKNLGDRVQICYKQPKNLKRIVGQQKGTSKRNKITDVDPGCSKCGKCRVSCPILKEGGKFQSTNTRKTFTIRQKMNCDTPCKNCRGQYVGKSTTPFKRRHSNHKQEIKRKYGGLGHHYGDVDGCGYENISIKIIDQVDEGDSMALAEREIFWKAGKMHGG